MSALQTPTNVSKPSYSLLDQFCFASFNQSNVTSNESKDLSSSKSSTTSLSHEGKTFLKELLVDSYPVEAEQEENNNLQLLSKRLKTKKGSKMFQDELESMTQKEIKAMHELLKRNYFDLIGRDYANYSLVALFNRLSPKELEEVVTWVEKDFLKFARHGKASIMIQFLVENSTISFSDRIFEVFLLNLNMLATSTYGCYVVQKMMRSVSSEKKEIIFDKLIEDIATLCRTSKGFYVILELLNFNLTFKQANEIRNKLSNENDSKKVKKVLKKVEDQANLMN